MNSFNTGPSERIRDNRATDGERTYSMFIHLAGLFSAFLGTGIVAIIVVGVMWWAIRKNDSPFLDDHGREAFNFQISQIIWFIIGIVLIPVLIGIPILVIGIPVLRLVGGIRGAMAAHRGEFYRYPMCFRFLK